MAKEQQPADQQTQESNFEAAFGRLEQILELMNSGTISLDDSLKLYEEADKLITTCSKKLTDAERKIEVLIKNRTGDPILGNDQRPTTQDFTFNPPNGSSR